MILNTVGAFVKINVRHGDQTLIWWPYWSWLYPWVSQGWGWGHTVCLRWGSSSGYNKVTRVIWVPGSLGRQPHLTWHQDNDSAVHWLMQRQNQASRPSLCSHVSICNAAISSEFQMKWQVTGNSSHSFVSLSASIPLSGEETPTPDLLSVIPRYVYNKSHTCKTDIHTPEQHSIYVGPELMWRTTENYRSPGHICLATQLCCVQVAQSLPTLQQNTQSFHAAHAVEIPCDS